FRGRMRGLTLPAASEMTAGARARPKGLPGFLGWHSPLAGSVTAPAPLGGGLQLVLRGVDRHNWIAVGVLGQVERAERHGDIAFADAKEPTDADHHCGHLAVI